MRRPWASSDVLLVTFVVVIGQMEMWVPRFGQAGGNLHVVGPKWVNVPAFLVCGLVLLWRRSAPMAVLAAVVATGSVQSLAVGSTEGLGWYLPLLIALYTVARHCDNRMAGVGLAMALGGMAVNALRDPRITGWSDVSLFFDIVVIDWVVGRGFRSRQRDSENLMRRAVTLERRQDDHARQVVTEERERIARELHDLVAHSVSLVVVQCVVAVELLDAGQPTAARERVMNIERAARQTLGEMRRLVGMLRPDDESDSLAPPPGVHDVPALIEEVAGVKLPVELHIEGIESPLPPSLDLSAYRIIQEALTNTLKHANAAHARVELRYCPDAVEIGVLDDGSGNGRAVGLGDANGGQGLVGMRERAALFGGSLRCGPRSGGGWEVRAHLPMNSAEE